MKKFVLAFVLVMFLATGANALELITQENAVVTGTKTENVYVFGGTVLIEGDIDGDLTTAGGAVTVNGDVTGDVLALAGMITINGNISGDLRTAGGMIVLNGNVEGDSLIAGGAITVTSAINGDALIGAGMLEMQGTIRGYANISAGTVNLKGTLTDGEITANTFNNQGIISGQVSYTKNMMGYKTMSSLFLFHTLKRVFESVWWFISVIVTALIMLKFMPNLLEKCSETIEKDSFARWLKGAGIAILMPMVLLLLIITIVGIPVTKLGLVVYGLTITLTGPVYSLWMGNKIAEYFNYRKQPIMKKTVLGAGAIALMLLIPVIGILVKVILFPIAFYSLLEILWEADKKAVHKKII